MSDKRGISAVELSKGVPSVFVNTEKGQKLFEMMRPFAEVEEATLEEGMVKQGNLAKSTNRPKERSYFYKEIDKSGICKKTKSWNSDESTCKINRSI